MADPSAPLEPLLSAASSSSADEYFRILFEFAPISLWEEDYSQINKILLDLRASGVENIEDHLETNPDLVAECMSRIVVLNVNRKTLEMFGATSKEELLSNINKIFRDDMRLHFAGELIDIWQGKTSYEREGINYSLSGAPIDIHLQWTILPGYEESLGRVLVSLSDVTARKKAERYLSYLGTHDVLTGLYNRTYQEEERRRLEDGRRFPVSIIICDLDGLKIVNDLHGHAAGDELLRRAAEVLKESFRIEDVVARIGGDEFCVLLPETDPLSAEKAVDRLRRLIEMNNTFYQGPRLGMSVGFATGLKGASLTEVQRQADDRMYQEKRLHHKVINKSQPRQE